MSFISFFFILDATGAGRDGGLRAGGPDARPHPNGAALHVAGADFFRFDHLFSCLFFLFFFFFLLLPGFPSVFLKVSFEKRPASFLDLLEATRE